MQNFRSDSGDNISAVEAQEVLKAWTNRQQAQGVDASVNSVSALAAGLGVSEDEVRRMLEDIRVQQRSQEIASGYLAQEQRHRKRLDITAAMGATIALVVLGLFVLLYFALSHRSVQQIDVNTTPPGVPGFLANPPGTGTPPAAKGQVLKTMDADGTQRIVDQNGINIRYPDGRTVQLNDPQAINRVSERVGEMKGREAAEMVKKQGGPLTEAQKKELTDISNRDADVRQAVKEVSDSLSQAPQAPQPPPASGR